MRSLKTRLLLFSGSLLGIFVIINLVWFWQVGSKFYKYEQIMEQEDDLGRMEVNGYYYLVKPAGYLSYETGHLSVCKKEERQIFLDLEANLPFYNIEGNERIYMENWEDWYDIDFSYYPRAFGKSYYTITYQTMEIDVNGLLGEMLHSIRFNKDLQQLNGDEIAMGEEYQQILDAHKEEILDLMEHAKKMWGLKYE